MRMSLKGKAFLASLEGIALSKYLDSVGVWTIGIGATKTEIPDIAKWPINKKLTIYEVFDLFDKSLKRYEDAVNKALKVEVEQHVFDALISWCYNVGVGWTKAPRTATVIKRINAKADKASLYEALMRFKKPKEIIGRRRKEAKLLVSGDYGEGKASVFPVSSSGRPIYRRGETINVYDYLRPKEEEKAPEEPQIKPKEVVAPATKKPGLIKVYVDLFKNWFRK